MCAKARGVRVASRSNSLPHPFRTPTTQARSWVLGSAQLITNFLGSFSPFWPFSEEEMAYTVYTCVFFAKMFREENV